MLELSIDNNFPLAESHDLVIKSLQINTLKTIDSIRKQPAIVCDRGYGPTKVIQELLCLRMAGFGFCLCTTPDVLH